MQIFAKMKYFYKRLQIVMMLGQNLWDTIAIVITLNSSYKDFDTTTANLLEEGDKPIDQI